MSLRATTLPLGAAHVEHALVRIDRVEHRRGGVAAGVEREARAERDAHAEHLERILLERDDVRRALHGRAPRGAGRATQRGGAARMLGDPLAVLRERELHVATRAARGGLAEEAPEELAVVVDDEPEAHGVAPRRRERRDRDAPGVAQDLAERVVELAAVGDGAGARRCARRGGASCARAAPRRACGRPPRAWRAAPPGGRSAQASPRGARARAPPCRRARSPRGAAFPGATGTPAMCARCTNRSSSASSSSHAASSGNALRPAPGVVPLSRSRIAGRLRGQLAEHAERRVEDRDGIRLGCGGAPASALAPARACSIRHTASTATSSLRGRCVNSSGDSSNVMPSAR